MHFTAKSSQRTAKKVTPAPGILIVNYKTSYAVKELLDSLSRDKAHNQLRVSVWDNSCDDTEFESLRLEVEKFDGIFATLLCTQGDSNLGYAGGNNAAWEALQQRVAPSVVDPVIIINPDVSLQRGSIADLVAEIQKNPLSLFSARTMTGKGLMSGQAAFHRWSGQSRQLPMPPSPIKTEYVYPGGHFMALASNLWLHAKGFSEDFFLYCEEADLTLRLQKEIKGIDIAVSDTVYVTHSEGLSTARGAGDTSKSPVTYEHGTRSRIILFRKHKSLLRYLPAVTALRFSWALRILIQGQHRECRRILYGIYGGYRWRPKKGQ